MLKAILQSIDEGIHVIDKNGITIYYNNIAAEHDGLSPEEVIGKPLLDAFPSLSPQTSTMLKVIETGSPIYNQNQTYKNSRGKLIDTVNTTIPIIVDKEVAGAVEIAKDYSRMKHLSNRIIEMQTKIDRRKTKPSIVEGNEALYTFSDIITHDQGMLTVINKAKKIAQTSSPVFVCGETGTGKELLVQSIHHASPRATGPFISQNCAAIPASLLESTLFGTTKGSFTGSENREGLFELAHVGTLFLDEIHTLPYELQAKLLRVLEDGVVRRIGSGRSVKTNVRIIVATNEQAENLLNSGTLRMDLYYRLNVLTLFLPPLRERMTDIEKLIPAFINDFNRQFNKQVKHIAKEAMLLLHSYPWPGNVRELRHCIESAMTFVEGDTITVDDLPDRFYQRQAESGSSLTLSPDLQKQSLKDIVDDVEKTLIRQTLQEFAGNIKQTAAHLKIPRQTLQYKITKYQLS
nr:sigma 54-interacting transcriptional regulator [Evansella caseinilytica]